MTRSRRWSRHRKKKYRPPELEENGLQFQRSVLLRYEIRFCKVMANQDSRHPVKEIIREVCGNVN